MEKKFTFRFYDVSRGKDTIPPMVDMLRQIAAIKDKSARERHLATDYVVRLENLEDDGGDAVVGEIIRCQRTNLPAEITGPARKKLTADRLGHSIVFRLNHKSGAFGVQHDRRIVSPGKVLSYLAAFNPAAIYSLEPKINAKAWEKFNAGGTRKLSVRIAQPDSMQDLSGNGKAASQAFKTMADAYDAPSILIEISMGHRKGFLSGAVNGLAQQLSRMTGGRLDRLSAVVSVDEASEEINLIEDRIVSSDTLAIDDRDPEINWTVKKNYICLEMKRLIG